MKDARRFYKVRNRYSCIVHDTDNIEFRQGVWNLNATSIKDESNSGILAGVVDMLDGRHTVDEISSAVGCTTSEVNDIVHTLLEKEIVSEAEDNFFDQYVDIVQERRAPTQDMPEKVIIVAPPEVAQPLRDGISETVPHLGLVVAEEGHPLSAIPDTEPPWLDDELEFYRFMQPIKELGNAYIIYAETTANPVKVRNVDKIMNHLDLPWLYGVVDGPFILIGPTTVPGRTPSWSTYEMRLLMNLREGSSYQSYKKALAKGMVRRNHSFRVQPVLAQLLVAHLLPEALSWIVTGTAGTMSHVYSFFTPTAEFAVHEILPLAEDPVGGSVAERDDFELYFGTRTLGRLAE